MSKRMASPRSSLLQVISMEQRGFAVTGINIRFNNEAFCRLFVANTAGHYTIVGTRIDSKQLG